MNFPDNIKVGPVIYQVTDDRICFSDKGLDGSYGETQHKEQLIVLNPDQAEGMERLTLFHEILHCVFEQSSLMLESDEEEKSVRAIDSKLLDVLRSNPELTKYLLEQDA